METLRNALVREFIKGYGRDVIIFSVYFTEAAVGVLLVRIVVCISEFL